MVKSTMKPDAIWFLPHGAGDLMPPYLCMDTRTSRSVVNSLPYPTPSTQSMQLFQNA